MDTTLPTQMLLKMLNETVWVQCKGEREYVGTLRGVDEYTNVILQDCVEYERLADTNTRQTRHKTILVNGNSVDAIVRGGKTE